MAVDPRVIQEMRTKLTQYRTGELEALRLAEVHQGHVDRFTAAAASEAEIVAVIESALRALGETP